MATIRIVIATGNEGKLAEIRQLLHQPGYGLDIDILPQSRFRVTAAEETGSTFRENALIKARHASAATGLPAIADDSGLEVAALRGRPGVHSARFAGPHATDEQNIDKLLADLEETNDTQRLACFRCVAVYVEPAPDSVVLAVEGLWPGRIPKERQGRGGFGYDPVFYDPVAGRTAAEMDSNEKNRLSHRGQAFRELCSLLAGHLRSSPGSGRSRV